MRDFFGYDPALPAGYDQRIPVGRNVPVGWPWTLIQDDPLMYIGPDVLMPIASALAAIAGALLLFGRRTIDVGRKLLKGIGRVFGGR